MGQIFKKRDRVEDQMFVAGIWVPLVMFFVFWGFELLPDRAREVFLVPCVFHSVTGFYCPGCGGTRAVAVLLEGNVFASVCYHPIVAYAAGFYVVYGVPRGRTPVRMQAQSRAFVPELVSVCGAGNRRIKFFRKKFCAFGLPDRSFTVTG